MTGLKLHGNDLKIALLIGHSHLVGRTTCPRNTGILHCGEGNYRGYGIRNAMIVDTLAAMFNPPDNFAGFMATKLGSSSKENITNQIAYSTPGPDTMPLYHFYINEDKYSDPIRHTMGVWDITRSIQRGDFNSNDFLAGADTRTPIERSGGKYTNITQVVELMKARQHRGIQYSPASAPFYIGASLDNLCRRLYGPDLPYRNCLTIIVALGCVDFNPIITVEEARELERGIPASTSYAHPGFNSKFVGPPLSREPFSGIHHGPGKFVAALSKDLNYLYPPK